MSINRWMGLVALVTALVAPAAATAAKPPQDGQTPLERTSAIVQPSITYVETTFSARVFNTDRTPGNPVLPEEPFTVTYGCTGFFVNPDGWVATAGHCVGIDDDVKSDLAQAAAGWVLERYEATEEEVRAYIAEHFVVRGAVTREIKVAWGVAVAGIPQAQALPARLAGFKSFERGDVALLKIDATNLPALKLDVSSAVDTGEEVVSVGFPGSVDSVTDATKFDPSFKDGTISSTKTIGGGLVQVYEVSAAIASGMSGGPTVNASGDVIGVNSFGINGETQPFNFVAPAAELLALMRSAGVRNEIGTANALYREGIRAYWTGEKDEALEKLDEAIELLPSFAAAQHYRSKAVTLPDEPEPSFPWALVGAALAALAVLVGAAAVLLIARRRRARRATPSAPAVLVEPAADATAADRAAA